MQVISAPAGLKAAVSALTLSLPLSALQIVLMRQAPWWRLPYARIGFACLPAFLICLVVAALLMRGRELGFYFGAASSAVWVFGVGLSAIRLHNISLGFFTLFLGLYLFLLLVWIRIELGRSFFDPKMRWYQGLPSPVPGLECELADPAQAGSAFRVSRLDREGAFIFRDSPDPLPKKVRQLVFSFRDHQIRCQGIVIRSFQHRGGQEGLGFQFTGMTPDARKTLGDFVETLKGEGYVTE